MRSMKSSVLVLVIVLAAYSTVSVKSQDCSTHKVQIVCEDIEDDLNYAWMRDEGEGKLTCVADDLMTWTAPGSSVSSVIHSDALKVMNLWEIGVLHIEDATVKFIPLGIRTLIPKLRVLTIAKSGLLSVDKENLREFGDALKVINLHGNAITSIDADLFKYNPNIKSIYLNNNPIRYIDPEFFKSLRILEDIEEFEIKEVSCMDQEYKRFKDNLKKLKWNSKKCNDRSAKTETENCIKAALQICVEAVVIKNS